jgi:flagellar FliJ protein
MADLKQLAIVKSLAVQKEQQALQGLSAAQQQMTALQQQQQTLQQYKTDYVQQITETGQQGVSVSKLILLQDFLAKIDTSLSQQRDIIARAQLAVDSRRTQWQKARQYLDSICHLINKQQQQLADIETKKQQKLSDEFAMMAHYRKLKSGR